MQFGVTKGKSEIYKKEGSRGMRRRRWKTGWTGLESELGRHKKKLCRIVGMAAYLPTLCFSVCRVATAASTTYLLPLALVRYLGQE